MTEWVLRYSRRARRYIAEIYNQLEDYAPATADDWLRRVHDRCERLRHFSYLGRSRPEIMGGVRSLLVDDHVVFYRVETGRIEIGRVVDQRRDLPGLRWPSQ